MNVYIETYGCQMNFNDSEVILAILAKEGHLRTERAEDAGLILVNTCAIRDNAEQRVRGRLDQFQALRRSHPGLIIGVVGCMAQRLKEELLEGGRADLVAGPDSYRRLPEMLRAVRPDRPQTDVVLSRDETYGDISPVRLDKNGVSAYISIMRGCNKVCAYCVVPYTRGAERSRDPESILREARQIREDGYRELCLLGQNVDSYRWTAPDGSTVSFARLLEQVAQAVPELRIRFSTSYPSDISDDVLFTMARHANVCHWIHFPVQSGSDAMLKKMRRKYDRAWYLDRIRRIREVLPDCGITTDVIAGFCGETEEDHRDTLSLFEEVGFDAAYMFCYSERPGTLAARNYPDDVPREVKVRRLNEIIELQGRKSLESNRRDIGRCFEVLVEGPSHKGEGDLCGRNGAGKMLVFPGEGHRAGDLVQVRVHDCSPATLLGKIEA